MNIAVFVSPTKTDFGRILDLERIWQVLAGSGIGKKRLYVGACAMATCLRSSPVGGPRSSGGFLSFENQGRLTFCVSLGTAR